MPLTEAGGEGSPVWSPGSDRIVFSSDRDGGVSNLYLMNADGTGDVERLTTSDDDQYAASWSANGMLLFTDGVDDVWVVPMEPGTERVPRPLLASPARERNPSFSPDGTWLAYNSDMTGQNEVYVTPFPGPGETIRVSNDLGNSPVWSIDGQQLFYRSSGRMMVVDVTGDDSRPFGSPKLHFLGTDPFAATYPISGYDVTPDGRFVMTHSPYPEPRPLTQINLIHNWFEELRRLVPTGR